MHIALLNDDSLLALHSSEASSAGPEARGGAAVVVDRLRRGFGERGHEVTLITTHRPGDNPPPLDHTISIETEPVTPFERHRLCVRNAKMRRRFDTLFKELKPDIVHAGNVHEYLSYECLRAAHVANAKTFLTAHDTFLVSFGRVRDSKQLNWWDHFRAVGRGYNPRRNSEIRTILNETDTKVVAISNVLKEFLELNGIHVAATIHNGTELDLRPDPEAVEDFKQKHNLTGPTILFGGRISGDKGIGVLLEAFEVVHKEIPNATLAIAGDLKRIGAGVLPADQTAIKFLGHLGRSQMQLAHAACSVVTTPSIYLDPFNLMNIEAMAALKPVVGTTFGGTPEIIEDGVTGFVRNPLDTESFAAALVEVLSNPSRAQAMGEAGRKRVEEHFTAERMTQDYLELFGETPL